MWDLGESCPSKIMVTNIEPWWDLALRRQFSEEGSLVQRELSAKLTEGLFYRNIDILADPTEISADFVIGNTNYLYVVFFNKCSPFSIFLRIAVRIMLRTVQFNYKFASAL